MLLSSQLHGAAPLQCKANYDPKRFVCQANSRHIADTNLSTWIVTQSITNCIDALDECISSISHSNKSPFNRQGDLEIMYGIRDSYTKWWKNWYVQGKSNKVMLEQLDHIKVRVFQFFNYHPMGSFARNYDLIRKNTMIVKVNVISSS